MLIIALLLTITLLTAAAPAPAPPPPAGKASAGFTLLAGKLEFAVGDNDTIRFTARGSGWACPWGDVITAQAIWSPNADNVMSLLAGQGDELTITSGTFAAEFANGDTIAGTMTGAVRPRDDGKYALDVKFVATRGTGRFAGITSSGGRLRAIVEAESQEFHAMLNAKLCVR